MWRWGVSLRLVTHMIVRGPHAETSSDTDRPTPAHLAHWRDKIRPARAARGHFRYEILPAHPFSPHVRYKTLPAHPKWLDVALFLHAGRVLYRSPHQEAQQGEICTERKAEIERADTTGHRRNRCEAAGGCVGRRRARPRCRRPVRRANTGSRGQRQTNFAHNFPRSLFETTRKRCNSNDANSMFEKVAGELRAKLLWRGRRRGLAGNTQTISTARLEAAARPAGPGRTTSRRAAPINTPGTTGVEGTGRSKRPGRGAGGRRQGQGGLRDRPLRAKLACGDLAGGPPPTGTHSGQASMRDDAALRTPAEPHTAAAQPPGHAKGAGTEVPAPSRLTQPLPRRGSGRMTVSPGDGDASTGTCRQRRPLPGQLHRSGRRSRCVRGPASAWWPGRRARRNRSSRR